MNRYWKMNWNWCYHSSAAGRVFPEKGNFDELTMKLYLEIGHKRTTRKKGSPTSTKKGGEFKIAVPRALFFPFLTSKLICSRRSLPSGMRDEGWLRPRNPRPTPRALVNLANEDKRRTSSLDSDFDHYPLSRNIQHEKDGSRKRDSTRRLLLGLDCHHTVAS